MDRIRQLFTDVKQVITATLDETRGRPEKPKKGRPILRAQIVQMVLIKLLATVMGWNQSQTHRQLTTMDPTFRNLCDVRKSEIPPRRTLCYRWNSRKVMTLEQRVFKRFLRPLLNQRNLHLVAMDMSDLPVSAQDQLADYGHCSKGGYWGYKFHLVTTRDGIPLAVVVTRANEVEQSVAQSLVAQVQKALLADNLQSLVFFVADAGYDGTPLYNAVASLCQAQLVCAPNPRRDADLKHLRQTGQLPTARKEELAATDSTRDKGLLLYSQSAGKRLYHKRLVIEPTIELLKVDMAMEAIPYWIKGVRKVTRWVFNHVFAFVAMLYCNKLHRRPLRQIACYRI